MIVPNDMRAGKKPSRQTSYSDSCTDVEVTNMVLLKRVLQKRRETVYNMK